MKTNQRIIRNAATLRGGRLQRLWCRLVLPLCTMLLLTTACREDAEPIALVFELVTQAAHAPESPTAQAYQVFQKPEAWDTYCRQSLAETVAPTVDFESEIVLGVYRGEKPTGGYGISVTAVELRGDVVHVTLEESNPPADAMLIQVITSPYALYRVTLPEGSRNKADVAALQFHVARDGALEAVSFRRLP